MVQAGLLNLALTTLLAGIPSSSPTLHELLAPENHAAAPLPAIAARVRLTGSPSKSAARLHPPTATPTITPASKHDSHRPVATPSPQRSTRPAVIRTAPVRPTPPAAAPTASRRPAPATSRPVPAEETQELPPSSTPEPEAASQHTPPGQTREPPGQAVKERRADRTQATHTPPGQTKRADG